MTDGMSLLDDLGLTAAYPSPGLLNVVSGKQTWHLRPFVMGAPPTPSRVARDLKSIEPPSAWNGVLYIVDHLSPSLTTRALSDPLVAVIAVRERKAIVGGEEKRNTGSGIPVSPARTGGRVPWGRMAVGRVLLRTAKPRTQTVLANEAGVTQQVVHQSLRSLSRFGVDDDHRPATVTHPERLWDYLVNDYPGGRGLRRPWTAVAELREQVERAQRVAGDTETLLSGDSAADEIAPWRRSRLAVLYAASDLDLSARFAPADPGVAPTLEVVVPDDPTIFATAAAWADGPSRLTDPIITAWEVSRSPGPDARDAVERLRERVLSRWGVA